jgi:ankyrin repeat protein
LQNDPVKLRDLLQRGVRGFNKSIDGATPLHRAAEIGAIECAEVLLEYNNDVNDLNYTGQTPYHVAALNRQVDFGMFLLANRSKNSCQSGCTRCRFLTQLINRRRQELRQQEAQARLDQAKEAEQAQKAQLKKEQKETKQKKRKEKREAGKEAPDSLYMQDLDKALKDFQRITGGPYMSKEENMQLKESQLKHRAEQDSLDVSEKKAR